MYPVIWIITTTPPVILILSAVGIIYGIVNFRKQKQIFILFLFWLVIPIARVTWHGANIYGGIRQIMEYVPALAILAGIGASTLASRVNKKILVLVVFLNLLVPIIKTYPFYDTYFNFLIRRFPDSTPQTTPAS